ncbi:MFS general substrate transporter, partial [Rhizodiscina lignyota]
KRRLPVQQLTILAICRFAEPISLTSIFPYLPEMIESFGVAKDDIAFWAGLASAIYSFSQCLTAISWGRLSDRFGRKPIILTCLANTMITSLLWGFSTNLPMALAARALMGAANGNVGIIRTMVAEMCPWKELQPRAFSIMPLIYNIGSVVGPSIGGALANPYHRLPNEPPTSQLLDRFPYAAPNLVAAGFFLVGLTTGILFLKETLATRKDQPDYGIILGKKIKKGVRTVWWKAKLAWLEGRGQETEPLLKSRAEMSRSALLDEESGPKKPPGKTLPPPSMREVLHPQSILNLIAYTMLAMHSIGYDQLIPVLLHHPKQDLNDPDVHLPFKFGSGFSATTAEIGVMFTLYGFMNIIFQLVLFPPIAQKYGVLHCLHVCVIAYPIIFFLTPFPVLLPGFSRIVVLFLLWLCKGLAGSFAFPCSTILLTNSAPSLRILGTLNGMATAISAVGRAAGPTIGGNAFTLGVKHGYIIFPFWLLGAIAAISAIPAFFLIEGEGFGGDESPLDESDAEDDEEEEEEDDLEESVPRPIYEDGMATPEQVESRAESEYGGLGRMISSTPPRDLHRTWSVVSSSVAESMDGDEEAMYERQPHGYGAVEGASDQPHEQRPSLSRRGSRRLRRKSSAPLGLGSGFRRMSTNLGQTRSGFGDGGSF